MEPVLWLALVPHLLPTCAAGRNHIPANRPKGCWFSPRYILSKIVVENDVEKYAWVLDFDLSQMSDLNMSCVPNSYKMHLLVSSTFRLKLMWLSANLCCSKLCIDIGTHPSHTPHTFLTHPHTFPEDLLWASPEARETRGRHSLSELSRDPTRATWRLAHPQEHKVRALLNIKFILSSLGATGGNTACL